MKLLENLTSFIIIIFGLFILFFSVYDIIFKKGWILITFILYAVLLVIIIYTIFLKAKKQVVFVDIVEEFEKTLKGGLNHFKCQVCGGIFAVKKSRGDNKKYIKMTCPDCGAIGVIPPIPAQVEEVIPEKKSIKANFKCNLCGEGITVWAEGTDLFKDMYIHSCPFCGEDQTMKRI
jgi:predicted RNA-binding Zn-ribbon protein involved in translation (DUF1610 family)